MRKVISYRQKLISLAKIYKIYKVLDTSLKLTTYEIELELLRNRVPIPSRRGYFSLRIINELINPFYNSLKEKIAISKFTNTFNNLLKKFIFPINYFVKKNNNLTNFSIKKYLKVDININKNIKSIYDGINSYFIFIY